MFADILQTIVEETRGGAGAVLMGYDGIAIEQFFNSRPTLKGMFLGVTDISSILQLPRRYTRSTFAEINPCCNAPISMTCVALTVIS